MSDEQINLDPRPTVALRRIDTITTYEVQEMELNTLDSLVVAENRWLAYANFTAGAFIATSLGWLAADNLSAVAYVLHLSVMLIAFVFSTFFCLGWLAARKGRTCLLSTVRMRAKSETVPSK